ncbi:MAG: hypothetical protein NG740_07800 [Omnitrophica bacterium]|nr:hypothetical protein [Candidatus Omnitrophota bacterium]
MAIEKIEVIVHKVRVSKSRKIRTEEQGLPWDPRNQTEVLQKCDISIIDFREVITYQSDPLSMFHSETVFAHYTLEGYRLLANQIADRVKRDRIEGIPWR